MYDAVIFDLDDTLLDFSLCEQAALRAALGAIAHGFDLEREWETVYANFLPHSFRHWNEGRRLGTPWMEIKPRAFESFLLAHGEDAAQAHRAAEVYYAHFGTIAFVNDGAVELIRALKPTKKLAMISNGVGVLQRGRLEAAGLAGVFDPLLVSDEAGIAKPDRRIFEMALARLAAPAHRVLFVGDSLTDDLVGSKDAGLAFCHYARGGARDYPDGYAPDHVIAHFDALHEILS